MMSSFLVFYASCVVREGEKSVMFELVVESLVVFVDYKIFKTGFSS